MKILIADDSATCRLILQNHLSKLGFEVETCEDGLSAYHRLQEDGAPHIAILDWEMPGMDGLQICREVRKQVAGPYVYLLLLTGKNRKQDLLEAFQAGADDFLSKPLDEDEMEVRLQVGQRILAWHEQLRIQATRDALTGLWNRGALLDLLQKELARCCREKKPVGVAIIDLDHFKRINDTYGHLAGDQVLREIGAKMNASLRLYDVVGRYGGEEFLVVLPGCDEANMLTLCNRLRDFVASHPISYDSLMIPVTASIGVTIAMPEQKLKPDVILRTADLALYRAKAGGRNRVEIGSA